MPNNTSVRVALSLIYLVLLCAVPRGQGGWDAVCALPAGTEVRIQNPANQSVQGRIDTVDDVGIVIIRNNKQTSVPRDSIRSITQLGADTMGKQAAIGAVAGVVGGLVQGYTLAEGNKGIFAASLAAGWAGIGALIGAIHGATQRQETLVYEAP